MKERLVRTDLKNISSIDFHDNHLLFSGKNIRSCRGKWDQLKVYYGVSYFLRSMISLSDEKVLVEDGKCVYHILDLNAGTVLFSQKMRRDVSGTSRFAISDDGRTAFRVWLRGKKHEIAVIDLSDLSYRIFPYPASLNGVADLVYIKDSGLLAMETQVNADKTCQNQVVSVQFCDEKCILKPLHTWFGERTAKYFDGRYVWESGYKVRDLYTDGIIDLLENSPIRFPEKHVPLAYTYYPEKKYLQIIDQKQNSFVDCIEKKIIAQYSLDPEAESYRGVLVGNEFWIGKPDGIYAMPFPILENK